MFYILCIAKHLLFRNQSNDAEHEGSMRFFRSKWLKGIYPFLLLALLGTGPFVVVDNQCDRSEKHELIIQELQPSGMSIASLRMLELMYGLSTTPVSRIHFFTKLITENYVTGTSYDPISIDLLTNPSRGPPRLITIL